MLCNRSININRTKTYSPCHAYEYLYQIIGPGCFSAFTWLSDRWSFLLLQLFFTFLPSFSLSPAYSYPSSSLTLSATSLTLAPLLPSLPPLTFPASSHPFCLSPLTRPVSCCPLCLFSPFLPRPSLPHSMSLSYFLPPLTPASSLPFPLSMFLHSLYLISFPFCDPFFLTS